MKKKELLELGIVQEALRNPLFNSIFVEAKEKGLLHEIAFLSVLAIGQGPYVFRRKECDAILDALIEVELCYLSLGGIVGYHERALALIKAEEKAFQKKCKIPKGFDLTLDECESKKRVVLGLYALPKMGMVFPIGGLGNRLNLRSEEGKPLPAAMLPFCGRSLLEGLVRDVQALEYLYFKLFSRNIMTPIAMMTSFEQDNHIHIQNLCEEKNWFDRPASIFFLFPQISVPVITEKGNWSMRTPFELNLHPGGHGAIWRMAEEKGVFNWFVEQQRDALLIRQINNPVSGVDNGSLAFVGTGKLENKTFGFVTCKRAPNTAEGVLVEFEDEKKSHGIANIEYTDFERCSILNLEEKFPTNTNILYINLPKFLPYIEKNPLPGLILNMKSDVSFIEEDGSVSYMLGGRLESMMQNISDAIVSPCDKPLETFLFFNERKKTISVTKRSFEEGKSLLETPVGAFNDVLENGASLLEECGMRVGKDPLFLYHPALGPLYTILKQKIRGGMMGEGSEMQLEISEILLEELSIHGSLLIEAKNVMGHLKKGRLTYSNLTGKCVLKNVSIRNKGIDRNAPNHFWKNEIFRHEKFSLRILGNGEFFAENITFVGDFDIVVPNGMRVQACYDRKGAIVFESEKITGPGWKWAYQLLEEEIVLVEDNTFQKPSLQEERSPQLPLRQ